MPRVNYIEWVSVIPKKPHWIVILGTVIVLGFFFIWDRLILLSLSCLFYFSDFKYLPFIFTCTCSHLWFFDLFFQLSTSRFHSHIPSQITEKGCEGAACKWGERLKMGVNFSALFLSFEIVCDLFMQPVKMASCNNITISERKG